MGTQGGMTDHKNGRLTSCHENLHLPCGPILQST